MAQPVGIVADFVADHKDQILDSAGDIGNLARQLPDVAAQTTRRGIKQTRRLAKNAARQPKPRKLGTPLALAAVMAVALFAALRIRGSRQEPGRQPTS